jgi:uncharacterized membrane protein YhaH (DUF805 family)
MKEAANSAAPLTPMSAYRPTGHERRSNRCQPGANRYKRPSKVATGPFTTLASSASPCPAGIELVACSFNVKKAIRGREMNFPEAVASGFRNYVNFDGRASRSEYWYWNLFDVLVIGVVFLAPIHLFQGLIRTWLLVAFLPSLTVCVRRLHDTDRTGWWCLISFIPIIQLVLIYWACLKGTNGPNRFGPMVGDLNFGP